MMAVDAQPECRFQVAVRLHQGDRDRDEPGLETSDRVFDLEPQLPPLTLVVERAGTEIGHAIAE